jgi:hypothetical protein
VKRIFAANALIRAGFLAASLLTLASQAVRGADVRLESSLLQPVVGETVEIAARVDNAPASAAWSLLLTFDPARLEFTGQWEGSERAWVADSRVLTQINTTGQARLGGYGLADAVRTGTLARLWFKAVGTGVTAVATANRLEAGSFGNALYSLSGVETRPSTPPPVMVSIGSTASSAGDGIPDAWRIRCFGATNAVGSGAAEDPDHDGLTNLEEYRAGTDPKNPLSALAVTGAESASGSNMVLRWSSVAGKIYGVERSTNLPSGSWDSQLSGIQASPPVNVVTTDTQHTLSGFYRVVLQ